MFRIRSRTAAIVAARSAPATASGLPLTLALALALGPALAPPLAHAAASGAGPKQAGHTAPQAGHTKSAVHRFLASFYGTHGPSPEQRERHVSDFLKAKQKRNPDQDVVLCAHNTPRDLAIGPVTVGESGRSGGSGGSVRSGGSGEFGWATVTAYWPDGTTSTSTAYVALDSQPIELHDVICAN